MNIVKKVENKSKRHIIAKEFRKHKKLVYISQKETDERIQKYKDDTAYYKIIKDIAEHPEVLKMKKYRQHCDVSTYEHCMNVSYMLYTICKKRGLNYKAAARAAMLHDFYLYDWRKPHVDPDYPELHAFAHPKIALRNASQYFKLNDLEKDIIVKHMWPATIIRPMYKESFLITLCDKGSAMHESFDYKQRVKERLYRRIKRNRRKKVA